MKKNFLIKGLSFCVCLALSANAVDVNYETGQDQSLQKNMSMNLKKSNDNKNSKRKFKSKISSNAHNVDVSFDPLPAYMGVADMCITTQTVAADFGMSPVLDDGIIDMNRKAYLENAKGSAMTIEQMGGDETSLKKYIACIVDNSAKIAQANQNIVKKIGGRKFTEKELNELAQREFLSINSLSDKTILSQYTRAISALQKNHCRSIPNMNDNVQCGTLTFSFVDNSVKNSGVVLSGGDKIYGLAPTFRVSMSDTANDGNENSNEATSGISKDESMSKSKNENITRSQKQTTNAASFIPK